MAQVNRSVRSVFGRCISEVEEQTTGKVKGTLPIEDLNKLYYDGIEAGSFHGDGFYIITGESIPDRVAKITRGKDGRCYIWAPTPFGECVEILGEIRRNIGRVTVDIALPSFQDRLKIEGLSSGFLRDFNKRCDEIGASYKLFEPGCGDARLSVAASIFYGMPSAAVEIDPEMIGMARGVIAVSRRHGLSPEGVNVIQGDIFDGDLVRSVLDDRGASKYYVVYLYLARENVERFIDGYLPFLQRNDLVVTYKTRLGDLVETRYTGTLERRLEIPVWAADPQIGIYRKI